MSRTFEVKTMKEGQQDVFEIEGDSIEMDASQIKIYRADDNSKFIVAIFQEWIYALDITDTQKKTPEF